MVNLKILAVSDPAVEVYVSKEYDILGGFSEENINIEFDIVPWDFYFDKLQKSFEGLLDYDIVMIAGHLWLKNFVEKGYLHSFEYDSSDIPAKIIEEMKINDKTYISPSFCDGHMVVYRKDILNESIDKILSIDDFIKIVKRFYEIDNKAPLVFKAKSSEILLDALPYMRDGAKEDLFYYKDQKVVCNFQNMRSGLEKYVDLKKYASKDSCNYGNEELIQAFINEEAKIGSLWSGQLGILNEKFENSENLGYATFENSWNVTWSFGITNKCKNKEVAEKFLEYLRSSDIDKLVGRHCGCPIRISSFLEDSNKFAWYDLELEMINNAKPLISFNDLGDKLNILYEVVSKVFNMDICIDEAMEEVKKRIEN